MPYDDFRTYKRNLERTWLADHAYDTSMRCAKLLISKLVDEVRAGDADAELADRYLSDATVTGVCRSLLDAATTDRKRELVTAGGIRTQSNRVAVRMIGEDGLARQLRFTFDENMTRGACRRYLDRCLAQELRDSERNGAIARMLHDTEGEPDDTPMVQALARIGRTVDNYLPLHGDWDNPAEPVE